MSGAGISGLSGVAIAGAVWHPGPIQGADRVNVRPGHTVKLAAGVEESLGQVPGVCSSIPGTVCPGMTGQVSRLRARGRIMDARNIFTLYAMTGVASSHSHYVFLA